MRSASKNISLAVFAGLSAMMGSQTGSAIEHEPDWGVNTRTIDYRPAYGLGWNPKRKLTCAQVKRASIKARNQKRHKRSTKGRKQ
jgi:hypothetical protein